MKNPSPRTSRAGRAPLRTRRAPQPALLPLNQPGWHPSWSRWLFRNVRSTRRIFGKEEKFDRAKKEHYSYLKPKETYDNRSEACTRRNESETVHPLRCHDRPHSVGTWLHRFRAQRVSALYSATQNSNARRSGRVDGRDDEVGLHVPTDLRDAIACRGITLV